jgi:hypothetical protein
VSGRADARSLGVADGDDEAVLWGRLLTVAPFAQLCRICDCSADIALLDPVVARLRSPGPTWHLRRSELALAYGRGEFGRARRLALESMRLAAHGHENMRTLTSAVIVRLNVMTGLDEWPADEDFSWSPPLGLAMRALWESAMGRAGEARRHYRLGDALAPVPRIRYLITYAIFAELAAAFEDASTADVVYQACARTRTCSCAEAPRLTMVEGSVQRYLGLTAGVLGRADEAVRWLRGAVQVNAREGMAACEALATLDLARALDRRGDRAEASALALSAAAAGERLGMLPLVRDARSLGAPLDGSASAGPLTRRDVEISALVARGPTHRKRAAARRTPRARGERRPADPDQARPAEPDADRRVDRRPRALAVTCLRASRTWRPGRNRSSRGLAVRSGLLRAGTGADGSDGDGRNISFPRIQA